MLAGDDRWVLVWAGPGGVAGVDAQTTPAGTTPAVRQRVRDVGSVLSRDPDLSTLVIHTWSPFALASWGDLRGGLLLLAVDAARLLRAGGVDAAGG